MQVCAVPEEKHLNMLPFVRRSAGDTYLQPTVLDLLQRYRLAERDFDLARCRDRAIAAGEQKQLTPRVDQQADLVIDLWTDKNS